MKNPRLKKGELLEKRMDEGEVRLHCYIHKSFNEIHELGITRSHDFYTIAKYSYYFAIAKILN